MGFLKKLFGGSKQQKPTIGESSNSTELIAQGDQLKGEGRYAEAEKCFKQVLTNSPRNERAWFQFGDNLTWAGDYGRALACFEQVVALNPDYPMAKAKVNDMKPVVNSNPSYLRAYQHEKRMFASISRFNFGS